MKRIFSIDINAIQAGWADLTFHLFEHDVNEVVSYVPTDSLAELVDSAIRAAHGRGSIITFALEPDQLRFSVEPTSDDSLCIRIGELAEVVEKTRYIRSIMNTFVRCQYTMTHQEYLRNWYHEFPVDALEKLKALIII